MVCGAARADATRRSSENIELSRRQRFRMAVWLCDCQAVAEASMIFLARDCRNDAGLWAPRLAKQRQRSWADGGMAQWVAHRIPNPKVGSSNLPAPILGMDGLRYGALGRSEQTVRRWETFGIAKRLADCGAAIAEPLHSKPHVPAPIWPRKRAASPTACLSQHRAFDSVNQTRQSSIGRARATGTLECLQATFST